MASLNRYIIHLVAATLGSAVLSFVPYVLLSRAFKEPLLLSAIASGAVLGYFINKKMGDAAASFVWILPLIWLAVGISDETKHFSESWAQTDRLSYVWNNFFGMACGESECLDELLFAAPCLAAVAYSLGAFFGRGKQIGFRSGGPSVSN